MSFELSRWWRAKEHFNKPYAQLSRSIAVSLKPWRPTAELPLRRSVHRRNPRSNRQWSARVSSYLSPTVIRIVYVPSYWPRLLPSFPSSLRRSSGGSGCFQEILDSLRAAIDRAPHCSMLSSPFSPLISYFLAFIYEGRVAWVLHMHT